MNVLVGVGAADPIEDLLPRAVDRAREAGDELTVAVMAAPDGGDDLEAAERRVRTVLDEAGFEAEVQVLTGHSGSELVEFVESGPFDRLAICGGERSPLGKIQIGSTTEFVLLNAGMTVTLLR
jgi:nucleotide-binding universal stress UspA family protein